MSDQTTNTLYIENASSDDQGTYVLIATNSTLPDLELVSYGVEVSYITGMDDGVVEEFEMYPNPVTGNTINISVDDPQTIEDMMIMNGAGQVVRKEKLSGRHNGVNVSSLTNGIYMVKVVYKNGLVQIEKLIVK